MIGPVQLMMIGFRGNRIPREVHDVVCSLMRDESCVHVLDMWSVAMRPDRTMRELTDSDLARTWSGTPGRLLSRLITEAGAEASLTSEPTTDDNGLFIAGRIGSLRQQMPAGSGVLILLVEHVWAVPLGGVVNRCHGFPVTDGWVGSTALEHLGLDPGATGPL
ncbi:MULTISPECIES: hypothetical protein [unclassified Micromonospora]|uniref:hypothetical protein n=1 Tax=unclassified Micromonospora TaxID=2617518 RepID=UPI001C214827|nr:MULTISPECIES: hypothetical protein [unclassified Micromonospora]MBU8861816.1 hypothetical protein [Micromonospora sp. WMMB482]MDM4781397.1 hypothetical protein [Micromonospora sp. b486]